MTPDPTLIEQVARAIERAWSRNHASVRSNPDIAWKVWTPEAEAAIATLQGSAALPSEAIFDMGFEWAMCLRGQTLEDSRAVGRTLFSDIFTPIADRLDTSDFNSFQSAELGICAAKKIIHAAMRATTPTAPDQDTGASVPDQALAVPVEPVARLDPSGFDPSRVVAVEFIQPSIVVEQQGYDGCCTGDKYIWVRHEGRPHLDALLATVHYNYAYHDNCTIRGVAERVASVIAGRGPAIATEARRAETVEQGSVHEGADLKGIAHD